MPDRHHSASRERLCWAIAAGFVAATWSTLYWARLVADWFRAHGWLTPLMWLIFASAAGAVLAAVLRLAPGWRELAVLAVFALAYALSIRPLMKQPEEALHFVQYGTIGGFFYAALTERRRRGGSFLALPAAPAVLAFLLTAARRLDRRGHPVPAAQPRLRPARRRLQRRRRRPRHRRHRELALGARTRPKVPTLT